MSLLAFIFSLHLNPLPSLLVNHFCNPGLGLYHHSILSVPWADFSRCHRWARPSGTCPSHLHLFCLTWPLPVLSHLAVNVRFSLFSQSWVMFCCVYRSQSLYSFIHVDLGGCFLILIIKSKFIVKTKKKCRAHSCINTSTLEKKLRIILI